MNLQSHHDSVKHDETLFEDAQNADLYANSDEPSIDTLTPVSSNASPVQYDDKTKKNEPQQMDVDPKTQEFLEDEGVKPDGLVGWNGSDDPNNPKNWSYLHKWIVTTLVSLISFLTSLTSSSVAPALPQMAAEFHLSTFKTSMIFAIYGFGFVVGSLPYGPLSELYGRVPVLHVSFFVFLSFNIASGFAQTYPQLLVFRILSAIGGAAPNTVGGGIVSDCFSADDIGRGSAFYGLAPRLGPALGPVIGSVIIQNLGWRWSFYITSMLAGVLFVGSLIFLRETRPSIRMKRKAEALRKETGVEEIHTKEWPRQESEIAYLWEGLKRPVMFLCTHHIIQYLALFQFFLAGTLYLVLQTYHRLFLEYYHESIQISGLNYISIGLGLVIGNQLCSRVSDKVYNYLRMHYDSGDPEDPDRGRPEYRVPLMMVGAIIYPIGFLIYGWSGRYTVFWLVPNIGIFFVAAGTIILSQGIKLYNISAYGTYAASAQGAVNLTRAVGSGVFPLLAPPMLATLGYGWSGTVLAGISIVLGIPGPLLLWFYGSKLRAKADGLQKKEAEKV